MVVNRVIRIYDKLSDQLFQVEQLTQACRPTVVQIGTKTYGLKTPLQRHTLSNFVITLVSYVSR